MPGGRVAIGIPFVVFLAVAVFLVARVVGGGPNSPPLAFAILWVAGLVWIGYWWLFRIAAELDLEAETLIARSPLRTRRVAVYDVTAVRPMKLGSNGAVIEISGQRPILVMATKGFGEFVEELARLRPGLPVRLGWQARLAERLPGRSGTKRP